MAKVCICNDFNTHQIEGAFEQLSGSLPQHPSLEQVYQFYKDVYEWAGLHYHEQEGRRPVCHACFGAFVDLAIASFLEEHCHLSQQAKEMTAQEVRKWANKL